MLENENLNESQKPQMKMSPVSGHGLFTDSQLSYVNGVSDKDLRGHLLHQVRLRDLLGMNVIS